MQETRDRIIASAVELFEKKGYHSTTIQEIGEKAGVSKGAVFHYFSSKNEILFLIHEKFINVILNRAENVLKRSDLGTAEKLRELIVNLVELIAEYKPYVVVFFQEFKYVEQERLPLIKEKRDRCEQIYRRVLEQGMSAGEFRKDLDPDMVTKAIFGMCDWSHQWLNPGGRLTPREIGLTFWKILLEGIGRTQPDIDPVRRSMAINL